MVPPLNSSTLREQVFCRQFHKKNREQRKQERNRERKRERSREREERNMRGIARTIKIERKSEKDRTYTHR